MIVATTAAFIAAAIYASIAASQLRTMQRTLTEARSQTCAARQAVKIAQQSLQQAQKNFLLDQRPYIWLTNDLGHPHYIQVFLKGILTDSRVAWDFHYTNFGKTPAHDVRVFATVLAEDNADKLPRPWKAVEGPGTPILQGKEEFETALSKARVSQEEFKLLEHQQNAILLYGRIEYKDAVGKKYESGFCFHTLATSAIMFCKEKNSNYVN